jgi:hypothetical protein
MNAKLLFTTLVFSVSFCFSQTNKATKGKVLCDDFPLQGIEVLNLNSKRTIKTDKNGDFIILVAPQDSLLFISKEYVYKKICVKKTDLNTPLTINLIRKPEQLDEVVVVTKKAFPKIKIDNDLLNQMKIEKEAQNPKAIGVNDGTITNGADFIQIGKKILRLFTKPNENSSNKSTELKFKEYVLSANEKDYFKKKLHLKPEEIGLFLDFCEADPRSKEVLIQSNPLKLLDFILVKNTEFKKLAVQENK